jgi:hypothetical protein
MFLLANRAGNRLGHRKLLRAMFVIRQPPRYAPCWSKYVVNCK